MLQIPIIRKDGREPYIVEETISTKYILRISPTLNGTTNIWLAYLGGVIETTLSYSEFMNRLNSL